LDYTATQECSKNESTRPKAERVARHALGDGASSTVIVVGCSEQLPNEVRAYHLISAGKDGSAVLTRHDGVAYTGVMGELSLYRDVLSRMVSSVLAQLARFPPARRASARTALVARWNREWDVTRLRDSCPSCDHACRDDGPDCLSQA
jgi:hypothetical protein